MFQRPRKSSTRLVIGLICSTVQTISLSIILWKMPKFIQIRPTTLYPSLLIHGTITYYLMNNTPPRSVVSSYRTCMKLAWHCFCGIPPYMKKSPSNDCGCSCPSGPQPETIWRFDFHRSHCCCDEKFSLKTPSRTRRFMVHCCDEFRCAVLFHALPWQLACVFDNCMPSASA